MTKCDSPADYRMAPVQKLVPYSTLTSPSAPAKKVQHQMVLDFLALRGKGLEKLGLTVRWTVRCHQFKNWWHTVR